MIELFTSEVQGLWALRWQQFDAFGAFVDEGVIDGVETDRDGVQRAFRAVWTELLVARLQFDKVGTALRVDASRSSIETATGRRLSPSVQSAVL
jgi:hypothetical protein